MFPIRRMLLHTTAVPGWGHPEPQDDVHALPVGRDPGRRWPGMVVVSCDQAMKKCPGGARSAPFEKCTMTTCSPFVVV
eukprot:3586085-Pyramimonas_sp.AAC.1